MKQPENFITSKENLSVESDDEYDERETGNKEKIKNIFEILTMKTNIAV